MASPPLLEEMVGERVAPDEVEAVRSFAHAYGRRLTTDGAESERSEDELLAEIVAAFRFASARGRQPIAVRAFNPTRADDGYEPAGTVVETNTLDWPFLVDSVTATLETRGERIVRLVHPIVGVRRRADGSIESLLPAHGPAERESIMHFGLARRLPAEELGGLEESVREVLEAVQRVVEDYPAMRRRVEQMIAMAGRPPAAIEPVHARTAVEFLTWLLHGNFVLLGAREYDREGNTLTIADGSGLGLLSVPRPDDGDAQAGGHPLRLDALPAAVRERMLAGDLLIVGKTNRRSPVHRTERMDDIAIRRVDAGETIGLARVVGLFTSRGYAQPASATPVLDRKLARVLVAEDLIEGSHDYKAAVALFDSFPKDELFAAPDEDLRRAVVALLGLEGTDRVRLLGRRAPDGRSVSLILALPRERYDAAIVERLDDLLRRRFRSDDIETVHVLDEGARVRVHLLVHRRDGLPDVDLPALEREAVKLARTWDDDLRDLLVQEHGAVRATVLHDAWADEFPTYYQGYTSPATAAADISRLTRLAQGETSVVDLQPLPGDLTRVVLYRRGEKAELGAIMPVLEDLGLGVVEELATKLRGPETTWVQEFRVRAPDGGAVDLDAHGARVADAIGAVLDGDAETDDLNRLVIAAGLDRRQVAILRAYRKYRQRVGSRFTEGYQNEVLVANPALTRKLVDLFELRFDPNREPDAEAEALLREEIVAGLDAVASLDHDRILRNQLLVIDATLRTNAYHPQHGALAFKLASPDVPAMPQPAPLVEIYVYSAELEGIHLRGGRIARGGLRWSDRMDYRTEVYGLMRAQLTKNAVIVPAGAKGGFILKRAVEGRDELRAEVERQYVAYIRALLDVTDNLDGETVVHPPHVRVRDADDTYLVVAADKGTATFSDLANRVAREYGFWLDDAFASGGSAGYDHKALGITAKGAWESVKRHFTELGVDVAADPFTVVGIGDMSGDVFGNGMLLSDRIRLLAAYDHRHVFIDPDPDPDAGFAERRRLFELAGSSWGDYDRTQISEGGGVWPRSAKSIRLSSQARAALGLAASDDEPLAPTDVIRAVLRAPADLLWNGGIGTVVKASTETDADAQDRASEAIRVDACDLRARVVGEGGNLGFTRRARVEYAAGGGRINADFIDNSAGVDCSDHEVNLKILLGRAERRGELDREGRDELLVSVTDDVVAHVLYDSFQQAQIIAQEVARSHGRLWAYEDLMSRLDAEGMLSRADEDLPAASVLAERRRGGAGMYRPELATLLAYAKRWVARALEASALVEDPWFRRDLEEYFPDPVVERFGSLLDEHPLRRQLICMVNSNQIVNALGPTFVSQLVAERGAEVADVVRAFRIAREVTAAEGAWGKIERLSPGVDRAVQAELMDALDTLVERVARWYLTWSGGEPLEPTIAAGRDAFARVQAVLLAPVDDAAAAEDEARARRGAEVVRLVEAGVPEPLAAVVAVSGELVLAPDLLMAASATGRSIEAVLECWHALAAALRLDWMESVLERVHAGARTERWALQAVREDALLAGRELCVAALSGAPEDDPQAAAEEFVFSRLDAVRRLHTFLGSLAHEGDPDLAGLTLAVRQLRTLAA